MRAAIESGLNVIIDATNLNPKAITKWEKVAEETGSVIEFKLFKVGYKEALERDKNRSRSVGEKTIKQFFRNYFLDDFLKETGEIDSRIILEPDSSLPFCIICDLDGTICLRTGRSAFDYAKVGEDKVDHRLQQLLVLLTQETIFPVELIFLSGREGFSGCKRDTKEWLDKHFNNTPYILLMREEGDHRKDSIIKKELYKTYIKDKYDVLTVFDDRDSVVKMWRELGLLCCQVYYGDF